MRSLDSNAGLGFHELDWTLLLSPPSRCPFTVSVLGKGSPTNIDYRKKSWYQIILTSLLEDLVLGLDHVSGK